MNDIGIPNFNPLQSVWGQFGPRQTKIPLNTTLNILMYDWECVPNISNLICRKHKSNRNSSFWNMINCSDQYFKIIIFELIRKWTKKIEGLLYNRKWRFFTISEKLVWLFVLYPQYMCHTNICWNSRLRGLRVGCGTYGSPGSSLLMGRVMKFLDYGEGHELSHLWWGPWTFVIFNGEGHELQ